MIVMRFVYVTGLRREVFRNARLVGSWDGWSEVPMRPVVGDDGCPGFVAEVEIPDALAGQPVSWGVRLDAPAGPHTWGICAEHRGDAGRRDREFVLPPAGGRGEQRYHLSEGRRLGAQKFFPDGAVAPWLRFSVWAPNARDVAVVFGRADRGYIANDGTGIDPAAPVVALRKGADDIWQSGGLEHFERHAGAPYMFRITNAEGTVVFRTDIHSRWQFGRGAQDPERDGWDGRRDTLDGSVSCSVVIDQDLVRAEFEPTTTPPAQVSDAEFWHDEHRHGHPVPDRLEDLVIYELHVGALGYPRTDTGTLADAIALLDHLVDLGINAVELLPLAEFSGALGWGYGDTHHFAVESSAGGRDKYKHFVRECHRRGLAVIQDVVYNHYDLNAERAEWNFDATRPEQNSYYWYEGRSSDYPRPDGGYLNNGSSGFAPGYAQEQVRAMFVSSAVQLVEDFHVDGLRVDLTQAIHRDNSRNADGSGVPAANLAGQQLLREWSRTLRMIRPSVFLIAEDHSGWPAVTEPPRTGGLGFDATWFAEFYHHLVGDADVAGGAARLLREAGAGGDGPLAMAAFADRLARTRRPTVVYSESHDEAGGSEGSARTIAVAVNGAPLWGDTRAYAEARCRVVAALTLLSAGTPMFFMGEEIGAQRRYRYDNIASSKEDLLGDRAGVGARLFRYHQDLIRLRRANPAVRSRQLDVIHADDRSRVIAFVRRDGSRQVLIVASLNNAPFLDGYVLQTDPTRLADGWWAETFNSDAAGYGGHNVGNFGAAIPAADGRLQLRLPANGVLVLQRR